MKYFTFNNFLFSFQATALFFIFSYSPSTNINKPIETTSSNTPHQYAVQTEIKPAFQMENNVNTRQRVLKHFINARLNVIVNSMRNKSYLNNYDYLNVAEKKGSLTLLPANLKYYASNK